MLRQFIQTKTEYERQKGAVLIWVAAGMLAFLGFAALAIDVGFIMASRNEAQNVADAAALAACRELGEQYKKIYDGELDEIDENKVKEVAKYTASKNSISGHNVNITDECIEIKYWPSDAEDLLWGKNSVQVEINDEHTNDISMFFSKLFFVDSLSYSKLAIASLLGMPPQNVNPGGVEVPFGLDTRWFEENDFNSVIKFHPSSSLAGWHVFTETPVKTPTLWDILEAVKDNHVEDYLDSEIIPGETEFNFTGGTLGNAGWGPFQEAFYERATCVENDEGVTECEWKTTTVVYDLESINPNKTNPNTSIPIVGFVDLIITGVHTPPDMEIEAKVIPYFEDDDYSRGAGIPYGTMGTIPNLVK